MIPPWYSHKRVHGWFLVKNHNFLQVQRPQGASLEGQAMESSECLEPSWRSLMGVHPRHQWWSWWWLLTSRCSGQKSDAEEPLWSYRLGTKRTGTMERSQSPGGCLRRWLLGELETSQFRTKSSHFPLTIMAFFSMWKRRTLFVSSHVEAVIYGHSMYIFGGWDGHDTLQAMILDWGVIGP
jgi:hypothetical protein